MHKDQDIDPETLHQAAINTVSATMEQLLDGRQREGEKLADMIEQRLSGIETQIALVRKELPTILTLQRQRLQEKLSDLKAQLDEDRLEQEMVIIANRADVDEEGDTGSKAPPGWTCSGCTFQNASPFRHACIEGFLDEEL